MILLRRRSAVCNARGMTTESIGSTVPEWDVADRMQKALRVSCLTVQGMADYLGVSRNTCGRWLNGHTQPPVAALRLWALRTGVPYGWLKTGRRGDGPEPGANTNFGWSRFIRPTRHQASPTGRLATRDTAAATWSEQAA